MKMIVDSNYLQSEALRTYLAASAQNNVVLTDYASMEAYKGDPQVIYRSMEILSDFPKQVIVLKSTREICSLNPSQMESPDGLIDHEQSQEFPAFCRELAKARRGDRLLQAQLAQLRHDAADHIDRMLGGMPQLNLGFAQIESIYSSNELKTIRRGEKLTPSICQKLMAHIMQLAAYLFSTHPDVVALPKGLEVRNTFIFRHAICAYLLALKAISVGQAGRTAPPKLRNDLIDANFATFATFFDGLLSADKKTQEIYIQADFLLREVFIMPEAA